MTVAQGRYSCKQCMNETIMEDPQFDSPYSFAEKVPCSKCGNIGANYSGSA